MKFWVELLLHCIVVLIKFLPRFVIMVLFMAFYFSRYFPTDDLLLFISFFLASFGLWKIFDYLDSITDSLVKRFEDKKR